MALLIFPAPCASHTSRIATAFQNQYASATPTHQHNIRHLPEPFTNQRLFFGAPLAVGLYKRVCLRDAASSRHQRAGSRAGSKAAAAAFSGSGPLEGSPFFDSHIVKTELDLIQKDYKHLFEIGKNFCLFDRERKLSYIKEMKDVLERWLIFYKRMELSDDFTAKLYAKQLKSKVSPDEESNFDMVFSFYNALDDLKQDAEMSI